MGCFVRLSAAVRRMMDMGRRPYPPYLRYALAKVCLITTGGNVYLGLFV